MASLTELLSELQSHYRKPRDAASEQLLAYGDAVFADVLKILVGLDSRPPYDADIAGSVIALLRRLNPGRAEPVIRAWRDAQLEAWCTQATHSDAELRIDSFWYFDGLYDIFGGEIVRLIPCYEAVYQSLIEAVEYYLINWGDHSVKYPVELLGVLKDQRAVPLLINLLEHGDYYNIIYAATSLGNIGDPAAVPHLISLLNNARNIVSQRMPYSPFDPDIIFRFAHRIVLALEHFDTADAVRAVEQWSDRHLPDLIPKVSQLGASVESQIEAVGFFKQYGKRHLERLCKHFNDPDDTLNVLRWDMGYALYLIGERRRTVHTLLEALHIVESGVCWAAADYITYFGANDHAGVLEALTDDEPEVRVAGAYVLQDATRNEAVTALIAALDDPETDVRLAAVKALYRIGAEACIVGLEKALNDKVGGVRTAARWTLQAMSSGNEASGQGHSPALR